MQTIHPYTAVQNDQRKCPYLNPDGTKTCKICSEPKPVQEFIKNNAKAHGYSNICKACSAKIKRTKPVYKESWHRWYKRKMDDPVFIEKERLRNRLRKIKDRVKFRARKQTSEAVASGRLIKLPCLVCGSEKSQAHHPDYSKPLEVQWLCQAHHMELHRIHK